MYFGFPPLSIIRITQAVCRCRFVFADMWGNTAAVGSSPNALGIYYSWDGPQWQWQGTVYYYQLGCNTQCMIELGDNVLAGQVISYDSLGRGIPAESGMGYAKVVNGGAAGDLVTAYPMLYAAPEWQSLSLSQYQNMSLDGWLGLQA